MSHPSHPPCTAVRQHQRVFSLLLLLRRAKWTLDTVSTCQLRPPQPGGGQVGGRASGDVKDSGSSEDSGQAARRRRRGGGGVEHVWLVLRAELLHFIHTLLNHLALAEVHSEWQRFRDQIPYLSDVDAFRRAHDAFADVVAARCLLQPHFEPLLERVRGIAALAIRLRMHLETHSPQPSSSLLAAAGRWRSELRASIGSVLNSLRSEAARSPQSSGLLVELCRALDFNRFY